MTCWDLLANVRLDSDVKDKLALAVAKCLPQRLVYWCAVRVGAYATTGEHATQVVPDLTFMNALRRWRP